MNSVLSTKKNARLILDKASFVSINVQELNNFTSEININELQEETKDSDVNKQAIEDLELKAALYFAYNAVNFSFFPAENNKRWYVNHDGSFIGQDDEAHAIVSCLDKYQKSNPDALIVPSKLASLTIEDVNCIFKPAEEAGELPLLEHRMRCLHALGEGFEAIMKVCNSKNPISGLIEMSENSVVSFVTKLCEFIPIFSDTAVHSRSEIEICFHKRAQLLAAMLNSDGIIKFTDMDKLTIFADYKIPQLLRHKGILVYSEELAQKVDNEILLDHGCDEEIEIRAGIIHVASILSDKLDVATHRVDYFLWKTSVALSVEMKPFHRVRSIYY